MKMIKLHTPTHLNDGETQTEFDAERITNIKSVGGDDNAPGTHFWLNGVFQRQYCRESANQVRQMMADALSKEEVQLVAEAVDLLIHGANSSDGSIHFIEGDGFLGVVVGDFKPEPFRARQRGKYEAVRTQLASLGFVTVKNGGRHELTERGYAMGDFLQASNSQGRSFQGQVNLPPAHKTPPATTTYNISNSHVEQLTHSGSNVKGDQ